MKSSNFVYKEKKSLAYQIAIILLLLTSFILLFSYVYIGIAILIAVVLMYLFFITRGIELDFDNNKYRKAKFFENYIVGKWKQLPEIKYISVFKVIMAEGLTGRGGATITSKQIVFQINLIYGNNRRLNIYKTNNAENALKQAKEISKKLNLKIYDARENKGKWI